MFSRLLLLAGLVAIAGYSGGLAQESPAQVLPQKEPQKPKDEPQKPKEEPKKPKEEPKKEQPKTPAGPPVTGSKGTSPAPKPGALKKYDDVITKEAKTQPGVFTVHRIDDKVYFEVPTEKLGRLFMIRAEVSKAPTGGSMGTYNGSALGTKFVRLERKDNKLFLIQAAFQKRFDESTKAAVEATNMEPIIASYAVQAEGKDRSMVIEVTPVFMNDSLGLGASRVTGGIDSDKSFLTEVKAFPMNIEVRAQLTGRPMGGMQTIPGLPPGMSFGGGGGTAVIHYSMFQMPDEPMKGRYFDPRVGYFTEDYTDYTSTDAWVKGKAFITRFRLEKKDPSAEVSEVVKPITFYLAPEIPEKWRPFLKQGVEDWKPAFEKAGFKNAIVCKDAPTKAEDPNWDPEDARYSVIRWVAEPVANAMGPHVHDPRSGEIISAHIIFWHDILKIIHMWYFVQCSAVDERARRFPFPDELTGELLRYVSAHEVGHTLGLRHNHRASQAYSIEQLRDPKFVKENGNVASIMSYGRYNYVAQPEDKIPVKDLIPKLAPYDFFAIEWGYKHITAASSPEAEKSTLDTWAKKQIDNPFLRFGGEDGPSAVDPTVLTENIGNDPIKATELGFKNMDRVLGYLYESTTTPGEDFEVLDEAYQAIMQHRRLWLGAVLKQVGGVIENRTLAGPGRGQQFSRVPKEKQQAAVKFLIEQAFTTPKKLLDPNIVNQIKYSGVASDIMSAQRSILTGLLNAGRLNRLLDAEVMTPESAYSVSDLVADVQTGVFSELKSDAPKVDAMRRNLQRAYIETLKREFESPQQAGPLPGLPRGMQFEFGPSRSTELRAVARIALKDLTKQIQETLPKVKDSTTKAHLQDCISEIEAVTDESNKK